MNLKKLIGGESFTNWSASEFITLTVPIRTEPLFLEERTVSKGHRFPYCFLPLTILVQNSEPYRFYREKYRLQKPFNCSQKQKTVRFSVRYVIVTVGKRFSKNKRFFFFGTVLARDV